MSRRGRRKDLSRREPRHSPGPTPRSELGERVGRAPVAPPEPRQHPGPIPRSARLLCCVKACLRSGQSGDFAGSSFPANARPAFDAICDINLRPRFGKPRLSGSASVSGALGSASRSPERLPASSRNKALALTRLPSSPVHNRLLATESRLYGLWLKLTPKNYPAQVSRTS